MEFRGLLAHLTSTALDSRSENDLDERDHNYMEIDILKTCSDCIEHDHLKTF